MPNPFFQFKQFTIQQDKCAMKVCTDACIQGAWTAEKIKEQPVGHMLDIGCGTGLLSLMLAQKMQFSIEAIEINKDAAGQASENVLRSAWAERITIVHTSLQEFIPGKLYDHIICNPPFYEDDLRSDDEHKNAAKHDTTLKLEALILFIKTHLHINGTCSLMLPYKRAAYFEKKVSENGLFIKEKLHVKQTKKHECFRVVYLISKKESEKTSTDELIIHDDERNYEPAFVSLLKDYYLKL